MRLDGEGHIVVSPREVCEALHSPGRLINDALIPGTKVAFPTYSGYGDFLGACADAFGVHPRNFVVRGSAKLGFSVCPEPGRVWTAMGPDSDIDFAIIDPDYYHYLDREIRMFERDSSHTAWRGREHWKSVARKDQRAFYTCRYFDLPNIACVAEHTARLKSLPVEACCGRPRQIDAFIFRDWWSLYSRWDFDLRELRLGLRRGDLPKGGESPLPKADSL